jgi:WD40 repeat protein
MKVSKKTLFTQGAKQVNSFSLKGKESDVYEGHSAPILCSVFYKNYFFTGAADATIRGWSWKVSTNLRRYTLLLYFCHAELTPDL